MARPVTDQPIEQADHRQEGEERVGVEDHGLSRGNFGGEESDGGADSFARRSQSEVRANGGPSPGDNDAFAEEPVASTIH
jgi:hypothetical protein